MTKNFMYHAKTSDICNKLSKRFSHENLIAGTAISGRAEKQNRSLSERSASVPLWKAGTLTSLHCNSAKVFENLLKMPLVFKKVCESGGKFLIGRINLICRSLEFFASTKNRDDTSFSTPAALGVQRHSEPQAKNPEKNIFKVWILRFAFAPLRMTIHTLILAAVLSTGMISESWAEQCVPEKITINGVEKDKTKCYSDQAMHYVYNDNGDMILRYATRLSSGEVFSESRYSYSDDGLSRTEEQYGIVDGVMKRAGITIENYNLGDNPNGLDDIHYIFNCSYNDYSECRFRNAGYIKNGSGANGPCPNPSGLMAIACQDAPVSATFANIDNYCSNGCSSCSNGVCSSCYDRDYVVQNNACVKFVMPEGCTAHTSGVCTNCSDGYLTNDNGTCTRTEDCTGEYIADSENGACKKMPGCVNFADGACGGCERGFYKKEGGCVSSEEGCGSGYLEKDSVCISSANGCGAGYKDMGGFCNRIRYTPAEAAAILNDDDNTITITFKK